MSQTQELLLHDVALHSARGKDVLRVKVPAHEIAVLRVVHNGANVIDHGQTQEVDDFPVRAADEVARLQRKYRRINEPDPVRMAFPALELDVARYGFEAGGPSAAQTHSSVKHRPRLAKAAPQDEPVTEAAQTAAPVLSRDANGPADVAPRVFDPALGDAVAPPETKPQDPAPPKAAKAK